MKEIFIYIKNIFAGLFGLGQGMYISMLNMFRKKITEQYPENRGKKQNFENFRGMLRMSHNENNEHKCTACGICAMNCPNETIRVITKKETDENGKEKRILDIYEYNLGSCIFCALCTTSCPQSAIDWTNDFEHALFTKEKLTIKLNQENSKLITKNNS